jgi:hypothetical protein
MFVSILKPHMLIPKWFDLQTFTPESCFHVCIHPKLIGVTVGIACTNWWMMTYLFREEMIAWSLEFKGFSKYWVERFA